MKLWESRDEYQQVFLHNNLKNNIFIRRILSFLMSRNRAVQDSHDIIYRPVNDIGLGLSIKLFCNVKAEYETSLKAKKAKNVTWAPKQLKFALTSARVNVYELKRNIIMIYMNENFKLFFKLFIYIYNHISALTHFIMH